jgi:hypothetical protein
VKEQISSDSGGGGGGDDDDDDDDRDSALHHHVDVVESYSFLSTVDDITNSFPSWKINCANLFRKHLKNYKQITL